MAQIQIIPGKAEIQLTARSRVNKLPPVLADIPGGLYPLMSAAFEVDEYRIMSGWPVPIPELDVRINCLVSGEGDILSNRDAPLALVTNADMRWVADASYYDQTSGQWTPMQSNASPWQTTSGHAPTLITDYEYRIGDERFTNMTVLNFDSDTTDYMWNNLALIMGGTTGYTVIMVLNPNSIYGNDLTVLDNALWGPQDTTGAWVSFSVKDQAVYMTTEERSAQRGVDIGNGLSSSAPTYLALVVSRPQTTLYAASGPSRVLVKALAAGATAEPLSTRFWLGNSPLAGTGTMDMALFDMGIYGTPLTRTQVLSEITALSTVYGGDT